MTLTGLYKSLSKPNQKIIEPEPGLVLTLSIWYKTSSNLDVHLPEPGHLHFVQVHFTTDKIRPGSTKIFLVEPEVEPCQEIQKTQHAGGKVEGSWQDHVAMNYHRFSLW